jgi:hypothetical protein
MSTEEQFLSLLDSLPPQKQNEIGDLVSFLSRNNEKRQQKDLEGLWKELCDDISFEEFQEYRRQMWANFPREFPE